MPQTLDADDELGLSDYARVLRRRWSWVLLPLVTILALAAAATLRQAPRFCATAQVLIADSEAQVAIQGDANVSVANRDLANEINIAYSDTVRLEVVDLLGVEPAVTIDGESDSDVLWFRGCGSTPADAAGHANAWAEVYVSTKQREAAGNIGSAVTGFEIRLEELRTKRQELRRDVETQRRLLAGALTDGERRSIEAEIDRLNADLAVETDLVDAQIETIARNITLLEMDSELARTGTARVIQLAAPPVEGANAPLSRNLILGGLIGLVVGGAAALVVENLDRSIKTVDDVIGIPVLGSIPKPGRELRQRDMSLATMNHTGTPVAEAYQKVRTAVEFAVLGRKLTSLLITSPNQSEGKTTTSSNLAWAMSAVDHRVILADVDFRRPRLHEVFGCRVEPGLSDNLLKEIPLNKLALRVDDDRRNLVIIPTGTRPPSPADFVASPAFAGLVDKLEAEADLVVLDAPPILPVSDALSMARQVDGVIVVARAGSTSRDQLTETLEALRAVGADVLGVCLVGVKSDPSRYGYEETKPRRTRRKRAIGRTERGKRSTDDRRTEPGQGATEKPKRRATTTERPEPGKGTAPDDGSDGGRRVERRRRREAERVEAEPVPAERVEAEPVRGRPGAHDAEPVIPRRAGGSPMAADPSPTPALTIEPAGERAVIEPIDPIRVRRSGVSTDGPILGSDEPADGDEPPIERAEEIEILGH